MSLHATRHATIPGTAQTAKEACHPIASAQGTEAAEETMEPASITVV